jgi:hypothetical protein
MKKKPTGLRDKHLKVRQNGSNVWWRGKWQR